MGVFLYICGMAIVYQHIRKDKNEVFYIGIGTEMKRAYTKKRNNPHWNNIVKNHEYTVEILHQDVTWEQACEYEKKLISEIGRKDLGKGPLVNLTDGGEGTPNRIVSLSTKKLNREKQLGRKYSEETKKKQSLQRKGKKKPSDFGSKVSEIQRTRGGFFKGKKHKLESKMKTSEKVKGEKNPFFGKKHSQDVVLSMSGVNSKNSKLTSEQVMWVRNNYIPKDKVFGVNAMARTLNVSGQTVSKIVNGQSYLVI